MNKDRDFLKEYFEFANFSSLLADEFSQLGDSSKERSKFLGENL